MESNMCEKCGHPENVTTCSLNSGNVAEAGNNLVPTNYTLRRLRGISQLGILLIILAVFQTSDAYITVSMREICKQRHWGQLRLSTSGKNSSTSLILEAPTSTPQHSCRIDISVPETHSLSLLLTRRKHVNDKFGHKFPEDKRRSCNLTISFPLIQVEDEVSMSVDLCSPEADDSIKHTDLLPPQVSLEWRPYVNNTEDILASEIVITAVGRGREACGEPDLFPCISQTRYPIFCIATELACDGRRNCPLAGDDEDKELCSSNIGDEKATSLVTVGRSNSDHIPSGHTWELLASEIFKKISAKQNNGPKKLNYTTTTDVPLYSSDTEEEDTEENESIPEVLSQYGPWGYLMLGMLICGTVLMVCGLWECCCRQPKSSTSAGTTPSLLIINQGADTGDTETPATPGPPRYEDLDQPPSYTTLFPSSKISSTVDILPITHPITESMSNFHQPSTPVPNNNNNSSNNNNNNNTQVSDTPQRQNHIDTQYVFTIDLPTTHFLSSAGNSNAFK